MALFGLFGKKSSTPQLDNPAVGQGQSYLAQKALLDQQVKAQQGQLANEQAGNMASTINQSSRYGMDAGTVARAQAMNQQGNSLGNQNLAMGNQLNQAQGLFGDAQRFDQNQLINQQARFAGKQGKKDMFGNILGGVGAAVGGIYGGPMGASLGSAFGKGAMQ